MYRKQLKEKQLKGDIWANLMDNHNAQLGDDLRSNLRLKLRVELGKDIRDQLWDQPWDQLIEEERGIK